MPKQPCWRGAEFREPEAAWVVPVSWGALSHYMSGLRGMPVGCFPTMHCRLGSGASLAPRLLRRIAVGVVRDGLLIVMIVAYVALAAAVRPGFARRSLEYPDYAAVASLAGLAAGSGLLEASGALHERVGRLKARVGPRLSPALLLLASGLLAAVATNDAIVFVAVPAVSALARERAGRERVVLVSLALAAVNLGSALTPIGNPQDVVIIHAYGLGLAEYEKTAITAFLPPFLVLAVVAPRGAWRGPGPPIAVESRLAMLGLAGLLSSAAGAISRTPWPGVAGLALALAASRNWDWRGPIRLAIGITPCTWFSARHRLSSASGPQRAPQQ